MRRYSRKCPNYLSRKKCHRAFLKKQSLDINETRSLIPDEIYLNYILIEISSIKMVILFLFDNHKVVYYLLFFLFESNYNSKLLFAKKSIIIFSLSNLDITLSNISTISGKISFIKRSKTSP